MKTVSVETFHDLEPNLYEEDSYYFLEYYQTAKDWYVYDSDVLGISVVQHLTNTFCSFHGKVPFPENVQPESTYWSSLPLGIFRYKLLSNMSCGIAIPQNKEPGYIVTGVYWDNGFCYAVFDGDKIIQIKLYIDLHTKETRDYPEVSYL